MKGQGGDILPKLKYPLNTERLEIIYFIRRQGKVSTSEFEEWIKDHGRKSTDRRRREVTEMSFLRTRQMTPQEREFYHLKDNSHADWIYEYVENSLENYSSEQVKSEVKSLNSAKQLAFAYNIGGER